jgi:hypothetical protein
MGLDEQQCYECPLMWYGNKQYFDILDFVCYREAWQRSQRASHWRLYMAPKSRYAIRTANLAGCTHTLTCTRYATPITEAAVISNRLVKYRTSLPITSLSRNTSLSLHSIAFTSA